MARALGPVGGVGAIAMAGVVLAACSMSSKPSGGGDPGNRRLHQLAADRIFGSLPPGARQPQLKLIPASYQKPGIDAGGWSGPGVIRTFESSAPPISVYRYYGDRAAAAGWSVGNIGSLRVASTWRKTYKNGAVGTLLLFTPRPFEALPGPRTYQLRGGISLPS